MICRDLMDSCLNLLRANQRISYVESSVQMYCPALPVADMPGRDRAAYKIQKLNHYDLKLVFPFSLGELLG
jgi:hypothetical protein